MARRDLLRKRRVVFQQTAEVFSAHRGSALKIAALSLLPSVAATVVLTVAGANEAVVGGAFALTTMLGVCAAQAALVKLTTEHLSGRAATVEESVRSGVALLGPALWHSLRSSALMLLPLAVMGALMGLAFAASGGGGNASPAVVAFVALVGAAGACGLLWLALGLATVLPALVLDRGEDPLRVSLRLAKGQRRIVANTIVLVCVLGAILESVASTALGTVLPAMISGSLLVEFVALPLTIYFTAWQAIMVTVLHIQLRDGSLQDVPVNA